MANEGRVSAGRVSAEFEYSLLTETRLDKFHHEFVLVNYSSRKNRCKRNRSIDSGPFQAGGYVWEILFFPHGENDEAYENGRTSLVLTLMTDDVIVPCLFELHLRDLSENGNNHGRTVFNRFPPDITYAKYCQLEGYLNFIHWERLESSDYLKEDKMIIDCKIQFITNTVQKIPLDNTKVDLLVQVADETFWVNRKMLSDHSTVFESHISDARRLQTDVVIPQIEPTTFKAILWFLCTGTLVEEDQKTFFGNNRNISKTGFGKLLAAAHEFKLERLKNVCQSFILEKFPIEAESVAYYFELSYTCHAKKMREACIIFASKYKDDVAKSAGLQYLKTKDYLMYLELAGLPITIAD